MRTFVAMRRFMLSNAEMFQRLDSLEIRQLHTEKKVDAVLDAISMQDLVPHRGITQRSWQKMVRLLENRKRHHRDHTKAKIAQTTSYRPTK